MKKNYINKIFKKCLLAGASLFLALVVATAQIAPFSSVAYAVVNKDDVLQGETLTQRGLSVSDCPSITAKYAGLMNSNGELIFERDSKSSAKIASMTKIMTAIVALENYNLAEDVVVSEAAAKVGESSAGLQVGDKMTMETALYALMVPSGNDAAVAIAETVGKRFVDNKDERIKKYVKKENTESGDNSNSSDKSKENSEQYVEEYIQDPVEAFVAVMNDTASKIGCQNTLFTNPHGLDNDEYQSDAHSCAVDVLTMCKHAMKNATFKKIVAGGDTTITVIRNNTPKQIALKTTDALIGVYEGCIGIKTGITDAAGPCFAGAYYDKGTNSEIYTVVMHSEDESKRFLDTQELFDWYTDHCKQYKLANSKTKDTITDADGNEKQVSVIAKVAHPEWVDCKFDVRLEDENQAVNVIDVSGNIHQSLECNDVHGSYKAGDYVGQIVFTQHNKEIARANLVAVYDQPAPNIFQMIGVGVDRIGRSITGQPTSATTELLNETTVINSKNN